MNNINASSTSIAPWLSVSSSKAAVAFYKLAFNAVEKYRLDDPDNNAVVKLSINGAEFWLSDSPSNEKNNEALGGNNVRLILTVDDPDTMFAHAIQAGAKEIFPVDEQHGWRLGRVVDPFGLHWEIGREIVK